MVLEAIRRHQLAVIETTFANLVNWTSGNHIGAVTLDISPKVNEVVSKESTGSQSIQGVYPGRYSGTWKMEAEVRAPAILGSGPPLHSILRACYGVGTTVGSVMRYTLLPGASAIPSLQLANYSANLQWYLQANGCIATKFEWEVNDDGLVMFRAEGEFADFSLLNGNPVLSADALAAATAFVLSAAEIDKIFTGNAGFRIEFSGGEDNSGAGYVASGRTRGNYNVTVTPALAAQVDAAETVLPWVPAAAYAATQHISGMSSAIIVDGTSIPCIGATLTVETGNKLTNKEATYDRPTAPYKATKRNVSGKLSMYMKPENATIFGSGLVYAARDLVIRMGVDVVGYKVEHNIPAAILKFPSDFEIGTEEAAEVNIEFTGIQDAASDDELYTDI